MLCRVNLFLVTLGFVCSMAGCAPQVMPPSGTRTPTSPDQVMIYQKQPHKYEDLGMVTVPIGGEIRMDDRGDATAGFTELKKKAAALGANGLLLDEDKVTSAATVTAASNGTFYKVPVDHNPKVAKGIAIWAYKD